MKSYKWETAYGQGSLSPAPQQTFSLGSLLQNISHGFINNNSRRFINCAFTNFIRNNSDRIIDGHFHRCVESICNIIVWRQQFSYIYNNFHRYIDQKIYKPQFLEVYNQQFSQKYRPKFSQIHCQDFHIQFSQIYRQHFPRFVSKQQFS